MFCNVQEVDVLKLVSYDRNVVQFYGTCPYGNQTMLVLEYMEVKHDCCQHTVHALSHTIASCFLTIVCCLSQL